MDGAFSGDITREIRRPIDCTMVSVDTLVSANRAVMCRSRNEARTCGALAVPAGLHPPRRQLDDSISRATFRIEPGSNPNLHSSAFRGADPPKVCMPITRPFGPT
jgi:hypothetical protein